MIVIEDYCEPEWAEWYQMLPQQRWEESARLWQRYLSMGGRLDPEPDTQSPFSMRRHRVKHLLMGGQACVLYGAAEFSRDIDVAVLVDEENLDRFTSALN